MPDFATHHLFGDRLEPPDAARAYPALYRWGLQGPDLLFYRKILSGAPYHSIGSRMHSENIERLFTSMATYCCELRGESKIMAEAYMYGFAGHYCLDSTVHPYVYAQQELMSAQHPERSLAGVHGGIESDIDMDLYSSVHSRSVCSFRPTDYYKLDTAASKALGALYTHILYDVYQLLLSPSEVIATVQDALALQKLLFSGSRVLMTATTLIDSTKGKGSRYYSSHMKGKRPDWDSLNLSHNSWCNPFTNELHSESVPELMEQAGEKYAQLASVLCRNAGGALLRIPTDKDFSGRAVE